MEGPAAPGILPVCLGHGGQMTMSAKQGLSLLELMIAVAIMSVVMGMMFMLMMGMDKTADLEKAKLVVNDDVRLAALRLLRDVRQATADSIIITWEANDVLQYRVPVDSDGNGIPLDVQMRLETSPVRTIMRDVDDINQDGVSETQLVMVEEDRVVVFANNLVLNEDADGNGRLDNGEDRNGNGVLDCGLRFERLPEGIHVLIQSERQASSAGGIIISSIEQTVNPRN